MSVPRRRSRKVVNLSICEERGQYQALDRYLDKHAADIENQDRLSFALEYRQVDSISYSFPEDAVELDVPKVMGSSAALGMGAHSPRWG